MARKIAPASIIQKKKRTPKLFSSETRSINARHNVQKFHKRATNARTHINEPELGQKLPTESRERHKWTIKCTINGPNVVRKSATDYIHCIFHDQRERRVRNVNETLTHPRRFFGWKGGMPLAVVGGKAVSKKLGTGHNIECPSEAISLWK